MSHSKNQRSKAKRRELDALNPERKRIRNQIRTGKLPRYRIAQEIETIPTVWVDGDPVEFKTRTHYRLKSVFEELTGDDTKRLAALKRKVAEQ